MLIYAQPGNGRRASLFTDYTFGVWDEGKLVPFAKAYSGLTDEEIREVDAFVRRNTIEKFGPVHAVKPELVFELAFEGDPAIAAPSLRNRRTLPADGPLAPRQEGGRRRYPRHDPRAAGLELTRTQRRGRKSPPRQKNLWVTGAFEWRPGLDSRGRRTLDSADPALCS